MLCPHRRNYLQRHYLPEDEASRNQPSGEAEKHEEHDAEANLPKAPERALPMSPEPFLMLELNSGLGISRYCTTLLIDEGHMT